MKVNDILRAEHDMIKAMFDDWALEAPADKLYEVVYYVNGINDFANDLIARLEAKDAD